MAKQKLLTSLLLLCLFAAAGTRAGDARRAELEAALDAAVTQADMNIASAHLATYTEEKLETLESLIRGTLSGDLLELFDQTAVRWREYRDAQWGFGEKKHEGGSAQPLMRNVVRVRLADERIRLLQDLDPEAKFSDDGK